MTDVFDDMLDDLFGELDFVKAATYKPAVGDPVACRARFKQELVEDRSDLGTNTWRNEKTVEAILADIGQEPDSGDVFTIDGTDYTVTRGPKENDGYTVKVVVK